ncbi:glycosyl hydrolase [Flavobacterium sp.]|uniref:glycosyl hydrolase n=1 Tax=Flavobacterium sp. TaxID=239 RepID=UPI00286CE62D|nr:glycosyl hydrolase [Flavobacterium sp.]
MNKIVHFGTFLFLLIGLLSNTVMGQTNYVWNGTTGSWATATNWTPNGVPGTNSGDTATISNGGTPSIGDGITPISYTLARVTITNATGSLSGSTLSINPEAILALSSSTAAVITLNGGNIVNNGTLSVTSTSTAASIGITCATPTNPPTISTPTTYGYSGSGTLSINVSASFTANSSAVAVTSLNANTTYQMLFNAATTTINLSSTPNAAIPPVLTASYAIRATGGTLDSPLIIGGTGFTIGGVNGGLLSLGSQSTVTVNAGTTLTLNSSNTNVTNGILGGNSTATPTQFTNKGTINILGETLRNGLAFNTNSAAAGDDRKIRIINDGVLNVDIIASSPTASGVSYAAFAITDPSAGVGNPTGSLVDVVNNGTLSLKNSSNALSTGFAIWGTAAGQGAESKFTNNGVFNLSSTVNSAYQRVAIVNNNVLNSNGPITPSRGLINNTSGTINFTNSPANFSVLAIVAATAGATYTDDNLNVYTISANKISGTGTRLLASLTNAISTVLATGSLTLVSGTGDETIAYTAVGTLANAITFGSATVSNPNSGVINTGRGTGSNLSVISYVSDTSTGTISPGGSTGNGIAHFSRTAAFLDATFPEVTLSGKLTLQISGSTAAGVDFDQITNSATNGGFDISAATLDITSLYTPISSTVIPIVTTSGTGTITGTFASITGLTSGWTISYASPTSVNLVYTVIVIPTVWTGTANNDFFNEANWRDSVTNIVPAANTINPSENINLHLQINSAATTITSGVIQFGSGSLAVGSANLTATSLSGGTVTINEAAYVTLSSATPFLNNVQINFTSGIGWIKTPNYTASAVSAGNLGQIKVNSSAAVYATNLRLDHYYLNGCVIRANLAATAPLTVYDSANLGGSSAAITVNSVHSNSAIANNMNNRIESFILKKGFMVTIAIEDDGTGKSKNYIASEQDLVINVLPQTLQNSISFIRVMPWNWVTKKGFNAPVDSNLDVSWRYQWNPNQSSTLDWEFAPMAWGHTSANDPADVALFIGKYNSPYVMSFNEPDDCGGQSGQYGNLCQTDVAVGLHKNLMKTGMRIVSPGGREEAPFGWLKEFHDKATVQDIRVDVIAVHWYDWGNNPAVNTNPTALQVFNRFKTYLTNVHNLYGLPIWITEFNANPARSQAINAGFLELALPYLESLEYIERYCWFPFNTNTHFTGWNDATNMPSNTIPTLVGTIYKNINNTTPVNSSPSIPEATVNANNSLDLSNNPNVALNKPATASSVYLSNVASDAVDGDTTSSTSQWQVEFATRPLPAWIEVNLQGSFTIDSFRIFEGSNAVRDFRFEIWDSTLNSGAGDWVSALTVINNSTALITYRTITPVSTTKVRLFVTRHYNATFLRMFELEVYGLKNNPTWTGGTSTAWTTATNWSTGIVPDQFTNVLIAGGATFQPTISATTTINSLTIATGAALTVTAPNLTVKGVIDNDGTMSVANNSNLIQGEEFYPNTGNVSINRNSSALSRLDYTIWSSPVENQNLLAFSPATSLNRFYNYNQTSNLYNAVASPSTTVFGLAAGNLIRMPNTHPTSPTVWNGTFTGVPNNGTITRVVTYKNEAPLNYGYNMIGNPYPSTLNASAFIVENTTKIESTLYFWRKTNGALGSAYATWINGIGGTASGAGSAVPNGTIQVGQGFFVRAKPGTNPALLTYNQTLTFNNTMRLGNTSTQFFKTKQETKDRVWLNLTNTSGVFSQALIGYVPSATTGVDDFDGKYINDSPIALTSNINNEEYTIQGRPSFDPADVVVLNFKTDLAGEYTIALDNFEGTFSMGQDVYLVDSKTGTETDLKASAYTFTAAAGVDNARFTLKYQKTLKVIDSEFNENSVRIYKNNATFYVNSGVVPISNIKVYDLQGRLIAEQKNLKANTAVIKDLKATHQVLIVKITGEDKNVVTKKVVN